MRNNLLDSASVNLATGTPVDIANTSAIKSSSTSATISKSPAFHSRSRSFFSEIKVFSLSLNAAAFSKS